MEYQIIFSSFTQKQINFILSNPLVQYYFPCGKSKSILLLYIHSHTDTPIQVYAYRQIDRQILIHLLTQSFAGLILCSYSLSLSLDDPFGLIICFLIFTYRSINNMRNDYFSKRYIHIYNNITQLFILITKGFVTNPTTFL